MSSNYKEDTSYKYRYNQKELLKKVLTGSLDEDLHISKVVLLTQPTTNDWKLNPIFKGKCFSGNHKLYVGLEYAAKNSQYMTQNTFYNMFSNIENVTHLCFDIKISQLSGTNSMPLTEFCRYAKVLEYVEIRGDNNILLGGFHCAFMDAPTLKTIVLRSYKILTGSNYFINNSNVDVIVFDSPSVANLTDIRGMNGPIFGQGGTGGTIYIPKSLYDHLGDGSEYDYKSATNWSTIDSYGTITWAQIEGSEYELI